MFNFIVGDSVLLVPQKRIVRAINNAFNPFGWSQYRQYNKGNVFEEIINNPVSVITEPFKALDREVIQPIYREVIQPVGHALEKIGQGIAKDPLTFVAQVAAVALAPPTGGMSLWALPVIAAASTAAKGGSLEQILTATAISAATAAVGGGFGMENSVGGLITSGMQTGGSIAAGTATFSIAGTSITASTASAIAAAGQGLAMGAVAATGAAATGRDPFQAALPSLVGSALGFAGNQLAQADFFAPITSTLNDISTSVSPIVSKAMTGVASAMITGAVTGKDMSQVAIASLANTAVSGLVSASNVVADFFRNDAGGITNMGVATQSVVADLLGSVAATVASGGKMGEAMGAQFLANSIRTLTPFLDPKFDALATNVQATYKDAEGKVVAVNDAANNQQKWVTKYNADADKLNGLATEVNDLLNSRDKTLAAYNAATTQSEINRLKAEYNSIESQIASKTSQYNALYDTIDDTNASYLESVNATEAAQKAYFEVSKTLGTLGSQLSEKMNEASKALTLNVAKDIDPNFNPEEYKAINNLGSGVDAATHYLSAGKDQGLPTNNASAQAAIDQEKQRLVFDIIAKQGYSSVMQVPTEVYKKAYDMVSTQYGSNLAQLKDATAINVTQWGTYSLGKTINDYMPVFNAEAAQKAQVQNAIDITITPAWYESVAKKDYSLPSGMLYASNSDVLSGTAKAVTTKNGYTVWVKPDPKSTEQNIAKYDPVTGNIRTMPASELLATKKWDQMNAAEQAAFLSNIDKATIQNLPVSEMEKVAITSGANAAKYLMSKLTDEGTSLESKNSAAGWIAGLGNIAGQVGKTFTDIGKYLELSTVEGMFKPLETFGDSMSAAAAAMKPDEMKLQAEKIQTMMQNAKTSGDAADAWAKAYTDYGKEVWTGMATTEISEDVYQGMLAKGAEGGFWAASKLTGSAALKELAGVIAMPVSIATNMMESYSGNRDETYSRVYDVLIKQGYAKDYADQLATTEAMKSGAGAAFTTGVVNGVSEALLIKAFTGQSGSTILGNLYDKITNVVKVAGVDTLLAPVEGGLQAALVEQAVYKYDPSSANFSAKMTSGALWEWSMQTTTNIGMGTAGAVGTTGAESLINLAYQSNAAFESAIKSTNYNMGELGTVLNNWVPNTTASTAGSQDTFSIRDSLVPMLLETFPQFADKYTSAASFMDAVKNSTGVWEPEVLANTVEKVADGKFAAQITTAQEAVKILQDQGLSDVTVEDALKSGIVGTVTTDQATKASQYVNTQMVSEAEVRAAAQQQNYTYTQAELDNLVGRGVEADVIAKFVAEIDPKAVTTEEAKQYFLDRGYDNATAEEIAQFVKSTAETQVQEELGAYVDPRQVTREEATQFYKELNYTPTEQEIQQFIKHGKDIQEAQVKTDLGGYVDPRMVDSEEAKKMLSDMGLLIPMTDESVKQITGQYMESELAGKAKEALPVIAANATYAETKRVADLVGKPAQDVTQADLDYIRSVVAGTAQGETNLGYDVNRDGKIDAADQTAIENQFAIQKNQNIQQQVDPATGQTVYVDTTTGQTVDYWEPAAGTPWAATGIYAELERQKAQAAATAKAQAAKAKTAQQQSQFGQLMGMLFQAPDVAGQQVAVKTPDPAKIGYIYDFSSIFANPSQASMMPSPYGPMNTVAPKQPQQAANQPLFQLASGFAEGGIVNSNDIQVGGSMDDLINILKGST